MNPAMPAPTAITHNIIAIIFMVITSLSYNTFFSCHIYNVNNQMSLVIKGSMISDFSVYLINDHDK